MTERMYPRRVDRRVYTLPGHEHTGVALRASYDVDDDHDLWASPEKHGPAFKVMAGDRYDLREIRAFHTAPRHINQG